MPQTTKKPHCTETATERTHSAVFKFSIQDVKLFFLVFSIINAVLQDTRRIKGAT